MKRTKFLKDSSGIYQIKSIKKDKIYIGSAVNLMRRKQEHLSDLKNNKHFNDHLQNHVNKYGLRDLQFSILEFCSKEKLIEREQHYINSLKPEFNICKIAGSTLGMKHTKETKEKLSRSQQIRFQNPMEIEKLKKAAKNKSPDSEETRKRKSIANAGKGNGMYGKKHSEESKEKNRNSQKKEKSAWWGKSHSEETKQKMRHSWKNKTSIKCPHCEKEGKDNVMYRWHFDNCSKKI